MQCAVPLWGGGCLPLQEPLTVALNCLFVFLYIGCLLPSLCSCISLSPKGGLPTKCSGLFPSLRPSIWRIGGGV